MNELQGSVPKNENSKFSANISRNIGASENLSNNLDSSNGNSHSVKISSETNERIAGIVPLKVLASTTAQRVSTRSTKADISSLVDKPKIVHTNAISKETSGPHVAVKAAPKKITSKTNDVDMPAAVETEPEDEPEHTNDVEMSGTYLPAPATAPEPITPPETDKAATPVEPAETTRPTSTLLEVSMSTMGDILIEFLQANDLSLATLVAFVETKAKNAGIILKESPVKKSFATIASQTSLDPTKLSFSSVAQSPSLNNWSTVGNKRAHITPKAPHKKWAERSDNQKRSAAPGTVKPVMPDLQIVHVRGFNVSLENPVTVLRDLIRDDLKFDTSSIWNLSGRTHTQIVELTIVKTEVPALIRAFTDNKFGLKLSTTYDPRRPDKVESESVALSNFKNRQDREIARIKRALHQVHQIHIVSRLRHVIRFLEAFRDGDSNDPSVTLEPIPYFIAAFEDTSVSLGQEILEREMSC